MSTKRIPFANPGAQYQTSQKGIDQAIHRVLQSGRYILGEETRRLEEEFADYIGARFGVGVGSGTDALVLALKACEIGAGDEVITTPHTAVATVAAIEMTGATPVLADIEPGSCLLDVREVERCLTARTRAIIPVHLFGQPAKMKDFQAVANQHDLWLIEDCAQAHGASIQGRKVGTFGDLACFSFYPTKNLGALGDGGLITTDLPELYDRLRGLREYGWRAQRYISDFPGMNSRLDELQAAVLRVKLRRLDRDNKKRSLIAGGYDHALGEWVEGLRHGTVRGQSVHHLYVIRTPHRDDLQEFLDRAGIGTAIHYPVPVHLQPAYRGRLGDVGSFPHAEEAARVILSLPMYPELTDEECQRVIRAMEGFFTNKRTRSAHGSRQS